MDNNEKKSIFYKLLILTAIAIPLVLGFSYAYFLAVVEGTENPTNMEGTSVTGFNFNLVTENNGYISASGIIPITSSQVETDSNKAHFKVITGSNAYYINYSILLSDIEMDSALKISDFRWELICTNCQDNSKNANGNFSSITSSEFILKDNISIAPSTEDQYELRIWLNESGADQTGLLNKSFSAKVTVTSEFGRKLLVKNSNYRELLYVESNGTQYVDTGINPSNMKLGIDIDYQVVGNTNDTYIFGELTLDGQKVYGGYQLGRYNNNMLLYIIDSQNNSIIYYKYAPDNNRHNLKFNITEMGTLLDDAEMEYLVLTDKTYDNYLDSTPYSIYIFGRKSNLTSFYGASVKIYHMAMYNGKTLIREYVPCYRISDNKPGLYDIVNNTFNPSNTATDLIAGPYAS